MTLSDASNSRLVTRRLVTLGGLAAPWLRGKAVSATPAKHLRIGAKVGPSSIDPHYHASGENSTILPHIYDTLLTLNDVLEPEANLATKWRVMDGGRLWEFELRQDVSFHDGSPFTAHDVASTIERVAHVRNSPGSYEVFVKRIIRIDIDSPYRMRFHTAEPHPFLDRDLSAIMILPGHLGHDIASSAFNAGDAAIGTGPYIFDGWKPGQTLELRKNQNYWGDPPPWDRVSLNPVGSDPTRIAALLNAEVDLVDHLPLADRERLGKTPTIKVFEREAARLMFIHLDSERARSPYIRQKNGSPSAMNPLRILDVRRALSLAVDRQAIVNYLLDGAGTPASQILPPSFEGSSKTLRPEGADPEKARRLLREAGYPNGFRLTLHSTSDRYPNDARVAQAIAQMWSRIGVTTDVETLTRNLFFPAAARQEFSTYFAGWAETSVAQAMKGLVHSYDASNGYGAGNRARYKNAQVDALIEQALVTIEAGKRAKLLARAQEIAFREDQGLIPLYHPTYAWAAATGLTFDANVEGATQAMRTAESQSTAQGQIQ